MIEGIQVKICGLTSPGDAESAAAFGADYLGFVLHSKSPRCVSLGQFKAMAGGLPKLPRVAVAVEPAPGSLSAMRDAGFDLFQIHFRHDVPVAAIQAWSREAGMDSLWLAPKLPPGVDVPEAWLAVAPCILLDTYDPTLFGGTGRPGDWPKFRRHSEAHPEKTWILSGGLDPGNVGAALAGTGARFVDVSSGVESSPGVKDIAKMRAFFSAVRKAAGALA
jgi:phosphoribosylanthranilate isomerase